MKRLMLAVVAVMSLSACVSLLPEPKIPQALYQFGPIDTSDQVAIYNSILIRQPEAPRLLAGVDIAARDNSGAIRLVEGAEWADRAPRLFQMTMLDYLSSEGEGAALLPETGARADFELAWRISEFSLLGNRATARVELTLLNGRDRKPLAQRTVESEVTSRSDEPALRAEALAAAGRDIVRQAALFTVDNMQDAR